MCHRVVGPIGRGLLFVLLSVAAASAQAVSTAQINGTAKDQSGAGLPGVTITVTQTDTGLTRTAVSDEAGSYILQNLPIGPYRFEAGPLAYASTLFGSLSGFDVMCPGGNNRRHR